MTAYSTLQTLVSRDLSDPDHKTFDIDAVKDFIAQGLSAISRVAPVQFREALVPVDQSQLGTYQLLSAAFPDAPVPEVRVVRVEVWKGTPSRFAFKIKSKAGQPTRDSVAGWEVWGGYLEIPQQINDLLTSDDLIRVWGYCPYQVPINDNDVIQLSAELELALRTYCTVEGLRRLTNSRVLFKQWQARSNNTDVTLGQLNSDLQVAEERWRRLARELKVPEQNPD